MNGSLFAAAAPSLMVFANTFVLLVDHELRDRMILRFTWKISSCSKLTVVFPEPFKLRSVK